MLHKMGRAIPVPNRIGVGLFSEELLKHFGNVPEPGAGCGEYFKKVSECFVNQQMGSLATKVVAGKICGIEDFIPFVKKATLARVKHTMDEFLNIVKSPNRLFVP